MNNDNRILMQFKENFGYLLYSSVLLFVLLNFYSRDCRNRTFIGLVSLCLRFQLDAIEQFAAILITSGNRLRISANPIKISLKILKIAGLIEMNE